MNAIITSLTTSLSPLTARNEKHKPESDNTEVEETCRQLVSATVRHYGNSSATKLRNNPVPTLTTSASRTWTVLQRAVEELSSRHETAVNKLVKKSFVEKDSNLTPGQIFIKIVKEMFTNDVYNWGRVATYYAFVAWTVKICVEENHREYIDEIEKAASDFAANNLSRWIGEQGGWVEFERFFKEPPSIENQIWNGLSCTLLGLGALAAYVATR